MPTYDYKCRNCENGFSLLLPINERNSPTEKECPKCHSMTIEKTIPPVGSIYNRTGALRTSDNFNNRLKEIKKNLRTVENTVNVR